MPEIELLALDHRLGARERQVYEMSQRLGPNWKLSVIVPMNQHSIIGQTKCHLFENQPDLPPEPVPLDYKDSEVVGFDQAPPKQMVFTAIVEIYP
jgi:hypothetical protein